MKKAIVVGGTSGIGEALANLLIADGYQVGITGRRLDRLNALSKTSDRFTCQIMDVTQTQSAMAKMRELIEDMGSVDLIVISAGVGEMSPAIKWEVENETIATNVTGFTAIASVACEHFAERGHGHLVGISSIAALRGGAAAPAYFASKAFVSNYLQGLRYYFFKKNISVIVTDVKPGFVDTAMAPQNQTLFWVATADTAAQQIYSAIKNRKNHAYITKRWRIIAWLIKILPDFIFRKI